MRNCCLYCVTILFLFLPALPELIYMVLRICKDSYFAGVNIFFLKYFKEYLNLIKNQFIIIATLIAGNSRNF